MKAALVLRNLLVSGVHSHLLLEFANHARPMTVGFCRNQPSARFRCWRSGLPRARWSCTSLTRSAGAADEPWLFTTRHLDRVTRSEPQSDRQLHDRIRARLGRVVSHPKSVHIVVSQGRVTLTGHILTKELDKLLDEVKHNVGVTAVDNQLVCHDSAEGISESTCR